VELNYPLIEKFAYALVPTGQKLLLYFKVHKVIILMNYPQKIVLQKLDASYRMLTWLIELSWYGIDFEARCTIKA